MVDAGYYMMIDIVSLDSANINSSPFYSTNAAQTIETILAMFCVGWGTNRSRDDPLCRTKIQRAGLDPHLGGGDGWVEGSGGGDG